MSGLIERNGGPKHNHAPKSDVAVVCWGVASIQ